MTSLPSPRTSRSAPLFPEPGAASGAFAQRVESALQSMIAHATSGDCPPRLRDAMSYAVFPGGARLRPRLCMAVAAAHGDPAPEAALAGAVAVELLHCASLVHDDLPCFDDAEARRGKPSLHRAFGEPLAVLTGDALLVLAFEAAGSSPRARTMVPLLARAAGASRGLIAGQAWEAEPCAPLDVYHRAKTASLFEAAAVLGALSAGAEEGPWRAFGAALGRAYQAADDVADAAGDPACLGKPVGVDAAHGRPSLVRVAGLDGARHRVRELVGEALLLLPGCPEPDHIRHFLERLAARLGA